MIDTLACPNWSAATQALVITEAAVKQHLAHLYARFAIDDSVERRRLTNEAFGRGILTLAELTAWRARARS